jgi:hypothetical protein
LHNALNSDFSKGGKKVFKLFVVSQLLRVMNVTILDCKKLFGNIL